MSKLTNKFLDRMFRRVDSLVWDLVSGTIGIRDSNGIYTFQVLPGESDKPGDPQVTVNPFDQFGVAIPAFAMATTMDNVSIGDIIVNDSGIAGWVVSKAANSVNLINKSGHRTQYSPPKVAVMGTDITLLVVKNLAGALGGDGGLKSFQGSLMPLLMLADDDIDLGSLLPVLMFSQQTGTQNTMSNMLPFMMMSKSHNGSNKDMMMYMMMSGAFNGKDVQGGANPAMLMAMSGMFGGDSGRSTGIPAMPELRRS